MKLTKRPISIASTDHSKKFLQVFFSFALILGLAPLPAVLAPLSAQAEDEPYVIGDIDESKTDGIILVVENDQPNEGGNAVELTSLRDGYPAAEDQGESFVLGEALDEGLDDLGMEVTSTIEVADDTAVVAASPAEGQSTREALEAAAELPNVVYAQPNYVYDLLETFETTAGVNDPYAQESTPSGPNQYWLYNINAFNAWDLAKCNNQQTIAVFDSGAMPSHPDLQGNVLTDLAYDTITECPLDVSAVNGYGDRNGHGTHVSGAAAARANNGVGIAGSSYNANVIPVNVINNATSKGSTSNLVKAFEYIFGLIDSGKVQNLHVVNLSVGFYSNDPDYLLEECIAKAKDKYNILSVAGGGNGDNVTPSTDPFYPSDYPNVMSVTALRPDNTNASWSDYNENKNISAPGVSIWSTISTNRGVGEYTSLSGTSMATPIVSGAVALLFAAVPDITVDEVCDAVYSTAVEINDPYNDRRGISGSAGRLDIAAALQYALDHENGTISNEGFADVDPSAWYGTVVYDANNLGYLTGYANSNKFGPLDSLLRGQTACIMQRMAIHKNLTQADADNGVSPFSDVDANAYFGNAVTWAASKSIVSGYGVTGTFGPMDGVTREQLATMLANYARYTKTYKAPSDIDSILASKSDGGTVSNWARQDVAWAVENGIMGLGIDTVNPLGNVSRAEAAAMTVRFQP